jgi:hypothetical protein
MSPPNTQPPAGNTNAQQAQPNAANPHPQPAAPGTDKSQGIKADGVSEQAAVAQAQGTGVNQTPEQEAMMRGPRASDVPASHVVGAEGTQLLSADGQSAGPEVVSTQEFGLNQADFHRILAQHFGFDLNSGVTEVLPAGSGFVVRHHKTA